MTPYTYLVGWSKLNLWYYGCQFGRKSHPDNLWKSYFTSSNYVKALREEFGEPDVVQIRKTFTDPQRCKKWEEKVIARTNAVFDERWINRANGGHSFNVRPDKRARSLSCKEKISIARARWCSLPENREWVVQNARNGGIKGASKISAKAKERFADKDWYENVYLASHRTEEHRSAASIRTTQLFQNADYRQKHTEAVTSEAYREKQRADSIARYATQESRDAHSAILKAALASPEARAIKSAAAKASTEKRLATRAANKAKKSCTPVETNL